MWRVSWELGRQGMFIDPHLVDGVGEADCRSLLCKDSRDVDLKLPSLLCPVGNQSKLT